MTLISRIYRKNKHSQALVPLSLCHCFLPPMLLRKLEDTLTSAYSEWASSHKNRCHIFRQFWKVPARGKPTKTKTKYMKLVKHLKEKKHWYLQFIEGHQKQRFFLKEFGKWGEKGKRQRAREVHVKHTQRGRGHPIPFSPIPNAQVRRVLWHVLGGPGTHNLILPLH